ncbi:MAG: carbamoyl-phosphate synthase large subunit [Bdellovibrionales bacterium]|nr:carbamoyl-phosphate synthase large subunit [Bdellovibrionales bacterium]
MPKRKDIQKVLILGSGPIVIGQACEFDYSGTQACKALQSEGLEVILVNSNPATIMTDPEIASKVYIEPLTLEYLTKIIEVERPDAIIPTLGGQTALNAGLALSDAGILKKWNVEMLGTNAQVIRKAEDRELFKKVLDKVGARAPKSYLVRDFETGLEKATELGLPIILRPNFTLGGSGGGIAYSLEDYKSMLQNALHESPTSEVLVEESILGWKEFELEVMRDSADTFVVVCSIENFDPCGVHTGDSITVAPQQTLSDQAYQDMRDEARKILREVGVETGGANIQFAVNPKDGQRVVIEMNPRVSRSSALASKATGFPIAKIAALLAIGYRLDEITNDITKSTPCCYEPALDYVVTKIPRFNFEKFPGTKDSLTTQMKSVGEVMGIGRTFQESLLKALVSLEVSKDALQFVDLQPELLPYGNSQRIYHIAQALREGWTIERLGQLTSITPWFLEQIQEIVRFEQALAGAPSLTTDLILKAKRFGISDHTISKLRKLNVKDVSHMRRSAGVRPAYLKVDTCAGEFKSDTPYFYSTYWSKPQERSKTSKTVCVLGSGANRIGQGIEFDYGCVRGVGALRKAGLRVAMINSNPETVSTDYDTANELYFEPLTEEFVLEVMNHVQPSGYVAQWGGQTSLNLSVALADSGYQLMGSSQATIDLAEDRGRFAEICRALGVTIPRSGIAGTIDEALAIAERVKFPLMCRPSYVLGGRRMEVLDTNEELTDYFTRYSSYIHSKSPLFLDEFLEGALEVDVDLVRSKKWTVIGGILEHIEAAGVHSGDSMAVLPPQRLRPKTMQRIEKIAIQIAEKLDVVGHLNLQLAIKSEEIFILEANPRSSRSVPFLAKAANIPIVDLAVLAMLDLDLPREYDWKKGDQVAVKGVVFPFKKFKDSDSILGPEMKSTGESMGRGDDFPEAMMKAFIASSIKIPKSGEVFLSLRDRDKEKLKPFALGLVELGFTLTATHGTASFFNQNGIPCEEVKKVRDGRPHCVDRIRSGKVQFVVNTTSGRQAVEDSFSIRRSCIDYMIPCLTESDAANAFMLAIQRSQLERLNVRPLTK